MSRNPVAFMSYVHADDAYGRLTELREHLSQEARIQIGQEFEIFQDRNAILWGQNWKQRIEESLDEVTFLIPIITPSFFNSPHCRDELQGFLEREEELNRNDLILPIYYVTTPLLDNEAERATDELAQVIATRQYADWRDLRFEPFTSPQVGKSLAGLVAQLRRALESVGGARTRNVEETSRHARGPSASQQGDEPASEASSTVGRTAAKTEPPTHVVDPWRRGDYPTIAEAIAAASPGDRILVRPGFYQEGLVIDKPLEIVGDGPLEEIVVQARGKAAILFQTTIGRVTNLTLRQVGDGEWVGVDITQGRLDLEGCDVSSESLSCIAVGGGADPRLRRNRIHDSKQSGVFIYDNGRGTFEDNEIFANALNGVESSEGGDPTLRRNSIHSNEQTGVIVYESGKGTLEDNEIFASSISGVQIRDEGSDPTLRRNRIHDNGQDGVLVNKGGRGTLEDNEILTNSYSGVEIRDEGTDPTLRRNRINENGNYAVWVYNGGRGTIEDNDLRGNALGAWSIDENSESKVQRTRNQE
jgi:parallel beta-helix repeat protein